MATRKNYDYVCKVTLVGDSGVGKSNMMTRFADDSFSESAPMTIGVDFRFRTLMIDDSLMKLQIWDTGGAETFRTMIRTYYRNTHVIMIVYDVTDKLSFDSVDGYLRDIEIYAPKNAIKMLVGNKADKYDDREVTTEVAKQFADDNDLHFMEVSAKTGMNIDKAFTFVVRQFKSRKLKKQLQLSKKIRNVLEENKFHMEQQEFNTFNSECAKIEYTENFLVNDAVDGYIGECNETPIKKLLKIKLKYSSKKRQRFYYILLTKLTKLKLFDRDNFIKILKLIAFNVDPNVDVDAIEQIIRQKQLDGNVFVKEATQYRASSKFAKLFAT
eukprot:13312_1